MNVVIVDNLFFNFLVIYVTKKVHLRVGCDNILIISGELRSFDLLFERVKI